MDNVKDMSSARLWRIAFVNGAVIVAQLVFLDIALSWSMPDLGEWFEILRMYALAAAMACTLHRRRYERFVFSLSEIAARRT